MGRRNTRKSNAEYPFLAELGLKTTSIRGDGNCLFRAFSDQLYGDQSHSSEIRAKVVQHMREHPDDFKAFVNVEPHGGVRRNPKRKNTAAPALDAFGPTPEQIDQAWEQHLVRMARVGEYGDNLEIRAFGVAYSVDIRIYVLPRTAYVVSCGAELAEGEYRQIVHIALNAEHYSSVRSLNDPGTGVPQVRPSDYHVLLADQRQATAAPAMKIEQWMVNAVSSSLPNFVNETIITEALKRNKGDVDATVSQLILDENSDSPTPSTSSVPSSPESTFSAQSGNYSIARDESDEDEEEILGPNRRKIRKSEEPAIKADQEKTVSIPNTAVTAEKKSENSSQKTFNMAGNEKKMAIHKPVIKSEKDKSSYTQKTSHKTDKQRKKSLPKKATKAEKEEERFTQKKEVAQRVEAAISSWHLITLRI